MSNLGRLMSLISWTDFTWNPFWGCRKVSEGCKYCYAEQIMDRFGKEFRNVCVPYEQEGRRVWVGLWPF